MFRFSSLLKVFKEYLSANLPGVTVEEGKFGELPSISPAVWIYAEPAPVRFRGSDSQYPIRRAKLTLFSLVGEGVNKSEAAGKAVEQLEDVENLIFSDSFSTFLQGHAFNINSEITIVTYTDESDFGVNFDSIYSDYAAAYLELYVNYAKI